MKILYIEDDKNMAKLVCLLFGKPRVRSGTLCKGSARIRHLLSGPAHMECGDRRSGFTPMDRGACSFLKWRPNVPASPSLFHSGLSGPRFGLDNRFELFSARSLRSRLETERRAALAQCPQGTHPDASTSPAKQHKMKTILLIDAV